MCIRRQRTRSVRELFGDKRATEAIYEVKVALHSIALIVVRVRIRGYSLAPAQRHHPEGSVRS